MNHTHRRIFAALLLGSYGLSVTVSGAFHTHSQVACHSCDAGGGHGCHDHDGSSGCDHETASHGESNDPSSLSIRPQADDCPVCSFLAHKPIQSVSSIEIGCVYLAPMRVCPKAISRIEEPLSGIWSRGPPQVG